MGHATLTQSPRERILFVDLAPSPGGSVLSLHQLVSHLDRQRFEPVVVLSSVLTFEGFDRLGAGPVIRVRTPWWEQPRGGLVDRVRGGQVGEHVRHSRQPALRALWHGLGDVRRLWRDLLPTTRVFTRLLRQLRPDLVHLNDALPLVRPALAACRLTGTPALTHVRSFLLPTAGDRRWLAPALRGLIFNSQAVAAAQLAALPSSLPYEIIPNAVDLTEFDGPVDVTAVRSELGVPPAAPLIGMFGRIAPWKGQHVFVEALDLLIAQHPTVHGVIVGAAEGESGAAYARTVQARVQALGLAERVHLVGFRHDVPRLLAAVDCVAHCSVEPEPFGRVIIEGMAAGRPVVATAAGGAAEIVTDGVDGLLTPPGDAAALAHALSRLLVNPDEARRLGQAGRATVAQRYEVTAHVAAVQAFYARLAAASPEV